MLAVECRFVYPLLELAVGKIRPLIGTRRAARREDELACVGRDERPIVVVLRIERRERRDAMNHRMLHQIHSRAAYLALAGYGGPDLAVGMGLHQVVERVRAVVVVLQLMGARQCHEELNPLGRIGRVGVQLKGTVEKIHGGIRIAARIQVADTEIESYVNVVGILRVELAENGDCAGIIGSQSCVISFIVFLCIFPSQLDLRRGVGKRHG